MKHVDKIGKIYLKKALKKIYPTSKDLNVVKSSQKKTPDSQKNRHVMQEVTWNENES